MNVFKCLCNKMKKRTLIMNEIVIFWLNNCYVNYLINKLLFCSYTVHIIILLFIVLPWKCWAAWHQTPTHNNLLLCRMRLLQSVFGVMETTLQNKPHYSRLLEYKYISTKLPNRILGYNIVCVPYITTSTRNLVDHYDMWI